MARVFPPGQEVIIEQLGDLYDQVRGRIDVAAVRQTLEGYWFDKLMLNDPNSTLQVIAWADGTEQFPKAVAERALWRFIQHLNETKRLHAPETLPSVQSYLSRKAGVALTPYPQGRWAVNTVLRDSFLPWMLYFKSVQTGYPPTRDDASPKDRPSIASLLAVALKRRRIKLKERAINDIYFRRFREQSIFEAAMPLLPQFGRPPLPAG
jgi:hypothetical protein